ncbi:MAG: type IV pilus twitching motility protein PilT [Candidatus Nealsonbacteria bacterium]|nr:type IV pilus twitching motility protein PilT [Candidatus Nealsonbacteria bacterium]
MDYSEKLRELLSETIVQKASDLHISVGHPPILRISGQLIPLMKKKVITAQDAEGLAFALITEDQKKRFLTEREIDFSYSFGEEARFRVNIFFQKGYASCALRLIPYDVVTIEELSLPPVLHEFVRRPQGFFLVTGPSGQGKSTTLAAMIDEINHTRAEHIITIEDPIEYLFKDDRSIICQREVYQDTNTFAGALKAAFRQDPDVIMIGEMRDPETMSAAITIAETGHLVFATLHTNSTSQSVHRIVDSFPAVQQSQIRAQLSGSLIGIMAQRLVPRIRGGLVPACEILINTPAVANLIRENKIHEIPLIIDTSAEIGMVSLNKYLANLVRAREIDIKVAQDYSLDPAELRNYIKR